MPPDPKKHIEELLEASARARREQFGRDLEMPGPMRAELHRELARQSKMAEQKTRTHWFRMWWPSLVIGSAMTLLLVGAPLWWSQRYFTHNSEIASRRIESSKRMDLPALSSHSNVDDRKAEMPATPPLQAAISNSAGSTTRGGELSDKLGMDFAKGIANQPASGAVLAPSEAPGTSVRLLSDKDAAPAFGMSLDTAKKTIAGSGGMRAQSGLREPQSQTGASALAVTTAPAKPATVFAESKPHAFQAAAGAAQQMQSQAFRARAAKEKMQLMQTFRFEQTANEISVIDADGSVYKGSIAQAPATSGARGAMSVGGAEVDRLEKKLKAPLRDEAAEAQKNAAFYFEATGSNATLQQRVLVQGRYIVPASQNKTALQAGQLQVQQPARIVGTLSVNGGAPIPIDATSVEP